MNKYNMNILPLISIILFFVFAFMYLHTLENQENFYQENENNISTENGCEVLDKNGKCLNNNNNNNNNNNFDLSRCPKIPDMSNYVLKSSIPPRMKCPPCICPKVDIKAESFNAEERCPKMGYYKAQTTTKAPGIEVQVQNLITKFLEKDRDELQKLQTIQEALEGKNLISYDKLDDLNESLSEENKKLLEQLHSLQNPATTQSIPKINIVNKINEMLLDINQNPEDLMKLKEIKNILMASDLETNVELESDKRTLINQNKQMKNELDEMRKIIQDLQTKKKGGKHHYSQNKNHYKKEKVKPLNYNSYLNNSFKQLQNNNDNSPHSLNKLIDHMMDNNNGNETKSPNSLKGYNSSNTYKPWSETNDEVCA